MLQRTNGIAHQHENELWADLAFDGEMVIHWFVIEEEDNTIEGETVDGAWRLFQFSGAHHGMSVT